MREKILLGRMLLLMLTRMLSLMLHLIDQLDTAFQKLFDSVCFFLMRQFGVRKSHIRYALTAGVITSLLVELVVGVAWGDREPGFLMCMILLVAFQLFMQHRDRRNDEASEARPGTVSQSDNMFGLGFLKGLALSTIVSSALRFDVSSVTQQRLGWSIGQIRFDSFLGISYWVFFLLALYLRRTPTNPPPVRVKAGHLATAETT